MKEKHYLSGNRAPLITSLALSMGLFLMTACGKAENLPLPTTIDTVRPTATTTPYTPTPTNIPCHGWHEMNKPQIVTLPKNNVTTQLTYNEEDLADGSKNFSLYMYDPNLKVGTEFQHVNGSELDILSPVKDKNTKLESKVKCNR